MTGRISFKISGVLYCSLLFLIIAFSFFNFSYRFYPLLNADMAINILMTPGYHLPGDLYAWGQDRGGSLIPMLSNIIYRLVPISPVSAVSLVHYLILIIGFFATATLIRSRTGRLLLAMLWFFPPWHFTDLVLFPFGTQFSLFMTGVFMFTRSESYLTGIMKHFLLALSCLLMILSLWVSELGLLMILLYILLKIPWEMKKGNQALSREKFPVILHVLIWVFIGTAFIIYAKSTAVKVDAYSSQVFNHPAEIISSMGIIFESLYKVFIFSSENMVESIYAWLLITAIPVILYMTIPGNKGWIQKTDRRWFMFFLLNAFITFIVIILSHWAFLNGVGRRYFVLVYLSLAIVILIMFETLERKERRMALLILSLVILMGSVSSVSKFYFPHYKHSRISILSEFQSLGKIGLISEYWNAYLSATPDPVNIKATPHDKDYVRNFRLADEVFEQPRIFIIKDCWMDSFPDTIRQFGRTLVKTGDRMYVGECWINQYEIFHPHQVFGPGEMKYQGMLVADSGSREGKAVKIGPGIVYDKARHFVYGPFVTLKPGEYIARFYIKVSDNSSSSLLAGLDVSSSFGKNILVSRKLTAADFHTKDRYETFDLSFECREQAEGCEFRIFYAGNNDLFFDRVELTTTRTR